MLRETRLTGRGARRMKNPVLLHGILCFPYKEPNICKESLNKPRGIVNSRPHTLTLAIHPRSSEWGILAFSRKKVFY